MSGIYICQNGDSFSELCNSVKDQTKVQKLKTLNAHLTRSQHAANTSILNNGQAIILPSNNEIAHQASRQFLLQSSPSSIQNLSHMTEHMTGRQALALAEVSDHLRLKDIAPDLNTFGGAGLGAATARSSDFLTALKKYDDALAQYFSHKSHRAAPATQSQSRTSHTITLKTYRRKRIQRTANQIQ